jgi:two-component system sensor histidine kinase/response regulator
VEDSRSGLTGRKRLLEENGYRVLMTTSGKDAVQAFASNPVDLVLLDDLMPRMNGEVAARSMRHTDPDVPIALVSNDQCAPIDDLPAIDSFLSKSEPTVTFLEKVAHLVSLRFLFRPFDLRRTRGTGSPDETPR